MTVTDKFWAIRLNLNAFAMAVLRLPLALPALISALSLDKNLASLGRWQFNPSCRVYCVIITFVLHVDLLIHPTLLYSLGDL